MIITQRIKGVNSVPVECEDFEIINVLKWSGSRWKTLCPYYLRTDGKEENHNPGNVLFENFYQGSKVYETVYENEVYPSVFQKGNPSYLWWKFLPVNHYGDQLLDSTDSLNYDFYYRWRDSLWNCQKPVRYPNKFHRKARVMFSLSVSREGVERRLDYITSRKELYVNEYIRLVRKTAEYKVLLRKLKKGENLQICEVDVPANGKKGEYGKDCDEDDICILSLEKLEILMSDPTEAFGHGLCLAYALFQDTYPIPEA